MLLYPVYQHSAMFEQFNNNVLSLKFYHCLTKTPILQSSCALPRGLEVTRHITLHETHHLAELNLLLIRILFIIGLNILFEYQTLLT